MRANDCDVAVVGGGPAGCATAIALRRRGVEDVLVVAAGAEERVRLGETIPPDTRVALERLGAWGSFLADGHEPCLGSCSAWGSATLGYNDFLFNPHGHGWHLDRRRFELRLAAEARAAGARVASGSEVKELRVVADRATFEVRIGSEERSDQVVQARYVVDATGRRSLVARARGARRLVNDRLTCVARFMRRSAGSPVPRLTLLEAVDYGWWYAAALPENRFAVAVATDADALKQRGLHEPEGWLRCLRSTQHLARALAGCPAGSERLVTRTAPSFVLDRSAGSGWLAVGDAAAACDPVSSQGIHNALSDGDRAAAAIAAAMGGDVDAMDGYHDSIARRFADYLANRNYFYALERRWETAPFWQRRRARASAA
jgi:flavin-dependent dehydrogenase